jgi:hypothetical protein
MAAGADISANTSISSHVLSAPDVNLEESREA